MSSNDEMTPVIQHAIKVSGVHEKIVNEVWPNGVIARCPACCNTLYLDVPETIKCLGEGWPKCCGKSMTITEAKAPK
jgi:hypothetical protein